MGGDFWRGAATGFTIGALNQLQIATRDKIQAQRRASQPTKLTRKEPVIKQRPTGEIRSRLDVLRERQLNLAMSNEVNRASLMCPVVRATAAGGGTVMLKVAAPVTGITEKIHYLKGFAKINEINAVIVELQKKT